MRGIWNPGQDRAHRELKVCGLGNNLLLFVSLGQTGYDVQEKKKEMSWCFYVYKSTTLLQYPLPNLLISVSSCIKWENNSRLKTASTQQGYGEGQVRLCINALTVCGSELQVHKHQFSPF